MEQNQINERENKWIMEWRNLSDNEKLSKIEILTTRHYTIELISTMEDDNIKLNALKTAIEKNERLKEELYITKVISSLKNDEIKEEYLKTINDEHNRASIIASMKNKELIEKYLPEITDGLEINYIKQKIRKLEENR